ncbi:hypothetical protein DTO164E3_37 [Paecilomyces variotii]|nr:hypothetical protein DTO032I3_3085 [Paecilomyces variotii]KAJ9207751.1 hypothetical protein DTO164E3_37 [Paecilomyces variotii]KAJ9245972.1 hypothetical protein DTO169E5_96 [Paecilomyces variotii]KAJ9246370.1 hypothetical protein DTO207G8_9024 [Paecilomyces variotii]KAJ9280679.1 hypothetical protein DTO021D3_2529 [Paecilomyces variotii]
MVRSPQRNSVWKGGKGNERNAGGGIIVLWLNLLGAVKKTVKKTGRLRARSHRRRIYCTNSPLVIYETRYTEYLHRISTFGNQSGDKGSLNWTMRIRLLAVLLVA